MKRTAVLVLLIVAVFTSALTVSAQHSGGGGTFGSQNEEEQQNETMTEEDASQMFEQLLQFLIFGGTPITAYIVYERKLSRSARASRRIMNMLDEKDSAWKFKNIMPRFKEIFHGVKKAWSQSNLDEAKPYTTENMLEKLKMQQAWADMRQQSCELQHVKLLDAMPVGVFDSHDDACDHIWFYVEWSALENKAKYNTSKTFKGYKEFWQLLRYNESWVLSDIIDKQTGDKLIFGEEESLQETK